MRCSKHKVEGCLQCFGKAPPQQSVLSQQRLLELGGLKNELVLDGGRLLYASPRTDIPEEADSFVVSNERHWNGLPTLGNRLNADVVVSIGSNMGWDQLLENNAKVLIVLDYHPSVAQIHEWVYRPLLLFARTPVEFLSLLSLIPAKTDKVAEFFQYAEKYLTEPDPVVTHQYYHDILSRVVMEGDCGGWGQLDRLNKYFATLCNARGCKTCTSVEYPFKLGHFKYQMEVNKNDLSRILLSHLKLRYLPDDQLLPCWLSVDEEFRKLQVCFKDNLYYCIGNIFSDDLMWSRIGELFGFVKFSINLSNVVDFVHSFTVGSRRPDRLTGLSQAIYQRYQGLKVGKMRLSVLLAIDRLLSGTNPNLACILYYYTVGGLDMRALHLPKKYIHFSRIDVSFDELE